MVQRGRYKDSLSRNRSMEEVAEDIGLSSGRPRERSKRKLYKIRNAGQGQVKIRGDKE